MCVKEAYQREVSITLTKHMFDRSPLIIIIFGGYVSLCLCTSLLFKLSIRRTRTENMHKMNFIFLVSAAEFQQLDAANTTASYSIIGITRAHNYVCCYKFVTMEAIDGLSSKTKV